MTVYIVLLVLVAIFSYVAVKYSTVSTNNGSNNLSLEKEKKPHLFFVWLVFLCIAFVAMFRYGVGTDFYSYYKTANWADKFQRGEYNEPGFTIFSILCSFLFGGINGSVTMGAALVTVAIFIFTIYKRAENFSLSVILFILTGILTGMFNGVRQYLATAILFAGYGFIVDKKPIKWLLVVLLASTFHVTSILMFFVYFVCNAKCSWKLVVLYLTIALVLLVAYEPLFDLIGVLKQNEINTNDAYMLGGVSKLRIAVQCVPILMLLFLNKNKLNKDKEARFLFNICLLNAAIAIAAMNSPYLSRFWIYTSCFQILMYPTILNKMHKTDRDLFVMFLVFFYILFWLYEILNASALSNFNWIFNYL